MIPGRLNPPGLCQHVGKEQSPVSGLNGRPLAYKASALPLS